MAQTDMPVQVNAARIGPAVPHKTQHSDEQCFIDGRTIMHVQDAGNTAHDLRSFQHLRSIAA
jgi:hypothetical protein